jgi:hypothetical protein
VVTVQSVFALDPGAGVGIGAWSSRVRRHSLAAASPRAGAGSGLGFGPPGGGVGGRPYGPPPIVAVKDGGEESGARHPQPTHTAVTSLSTAGPYVKVRHRAHAMRSDVDTTLAKVVGIHGLCCLRVHAVLLPGGPVIARLLRVQHTRPVRSAHPCSGLECSGSRDCPRPFCGRGVQGWAGNKRGWRWRCSCGRGHRGSPCCSSLSLAYRGWTGGSGAPVWLECTSTILLPSCAVFACMYVCSTDGKQTTQLRLVALVAQRLCAAPPSCFTTMLLLYPERS